MYIYRDRDKSHELINLIGKIKRITQYSTARSLTFPPNRFVQAHHNTHVLFVYYHIDIKNLYESFGDYQNFKINCNNAAISCEDNPWLPLNFHMANKWVWNIWYQECKEIFFFLHSWYQQQKQPVEDYKQFYLVLQEGLKPMLRFQDS